MHLLHFFHLKATIRKEWFHDSVQKYSHVSHELLIRSQETRNSRLSLLKKLLWTCGYHMTRV